MWRVFKKKISQIEGKGKKLRPFFFVSGGHGPDRSTKSLDFGHLPVVNSKGEPNFRIFFQLAVRADFDADWRI